MIRLFGHLKHKKHIIFDYNGTILYDTDLCVEALNHLRHSHDLPPVSETFYRQHFHFPISSFYRQIGFDFEKENFDELGQRYMTMYFDNLHRCRVYHGLRDLLTELRKHPIKISILTALNHDALHSQLQSFNLHSYFDAAYGLPDHRAHSKVQRGHELMRHMGIAPADTIVVGDTDHDHEVAEALGVESILLADGHQDEARLRKTKAQVINLNRKTE